ncbi:WD40 repeat-like protein [Saitoella complicata NRRL Y-17804]|uniref:Serine-threonine kinase receptor-associated protein n=1 Tax=Saitoella complicata (strain BCRC 22490 / CBS 7301 / JCM 7358 / NBRC 10748 / NRRL Y-17804) TaxID=698492 RepID=A0A0E9NPF7_SAICN|nr:WD40 repeat-like protein [Saitoella complicata NRRL Y-17804]ODQ54989.1 WD40 repeat-like protein [Saitoella complicata NRRL Y-17804]GAO51556.1 hypothetical protein G7K_5655-t1 [Saitoella complicata NRRL Y-17804]
MNSTTFRTPSPASAPANGQNNVNGNYTPRVVPLTCSGHTRPVPYLHFSDLIPQDEEHPYYFVSACKDGNPMIRDGMRGDWVGTFLGHKGCVWSAKISGDAATAVTGSADFTAKVWDTYNGQATHTFHHNHIVRAVDFQHARKGLQSENIVTGGHEKLLRTFSLAEGRDEPTTTFSGSQGTIKSVSWTTSEIIISAAEDKQVRWWDNRIGEEIAAFPTGPGEDITSCEVTRDRRYITVTAGKKIYFIDYKTRECVKTVTTNYNISSVALHPSQSHFVTGSTDDTWVRVYDFEGNELEVYKGHHGPIWTVGFSPDGRLYATGSEDGTIRLWKWGPEAYGLWK